MKVEVGKRYRTRDGEVTEELCSVKPDEFYKFKGWIDGYSFYWSAYGRAYDDRTDGLDLVAEVPKEDAS